MNETPTPPRPQRIPWVQDPRLLSFLPMLYIAWADGVLTKAEQKKLQARVGELEWVDDASRRALMSWLDPEGPPDARQLGRILVEIRRGAERLGDKTRRSLVELGQEMASVEMGSDDWFDSRTRAALGEIEAQLGVIPFEAARDMTQALEVSPEARAPGGAFDVGKLREHLEAPYGETRQWIKGLLVGPGFVRPAEVSKEVYRQTVTRWCQALATEGVGGLAYPGVIEGADLGAFMAAFETIACFDLSLTIKLGVQFGLFGGSVYFLGSEEQRRELLPRIASLELPGCFAMTERGHGSNVRDLETVARFDTQRGTFTVHSPSLAAKKEYIGNAAVDGRMATVFAQLEVGGESYGVHAFLVPIRDESGRPMPGVTIEDCGHKIGLNGVDNGTLRFERVEIPRQNLLSRFGEVSVDGTYTSPINNPTKRFFTMLGTLVGGRVTVGAGALSVAKCGLSIAVRYAARRRQFGPAGAREVAILDYRTHQRRLIPLVARAYAGTFAFRELTKRYLNALGEEDREVESLAAALKAWSTWNTSHTLQVCRECCGGAGYMSENLLGRMRADTDVFTTFEGDNTVLLQLVAKSLLMRWKQQFSNDKTFAVLKYIALQAQTALVELNPIVTRTTATSHLRDPSWELAAFRYREDSLLGSLARRLKKRIDAGTDAFAAFNDCQDHVLELGHAYADRVVLECFQLHVADVEDPDLLEVLAKLREVFALTTIESKLGWFMEQGYVEPPKAKAIRKRVNVLCAELREDALELVEAFGIAPEFVDAPMTARHD